MFKRISARLSAVCLAAILLLVSVVFVGCHSKGGDGSVPADLNINFGGSTSGVSGAAGSSGAVEANAAVPTVGLKLLYLNNTEADVQDDPHSPLVLSIKATFSDDMNAQAVEKAFSLLDPKSNKVTGAITWADKKTMVFKPEKKLVPKTKYALQISKDALSDTGGAIEPVDKSFTTMTLGDVNGDGVPDFVVGAPGVDNSKGAAYVYSGNTLSGGKIMATIKGSQANAKLGQSVAIVGDLDADGYADVVVGAPQEKYQNPGVGAIYGFSGKNLMGDVDTSKADAGIIGQWAVGHVTFGAALAGAGDLDNDGYDDIIVGSPSYSSNIGRVYIFNGKDFLKIGPNVGIMADTVAKAIILGEANSYFGSSVAAAGDVDDDKVPDIIVGAPGKPNTIAGKAYVFSSKILKDANLKTTDALVAITGVMNSSFGLSVAGGGDTDGDGVDDIVVGAPDETNETGAAYEFQGKKLSSTTVLTDGTKHSGSQQDGDFGHAVAIVGDVDGDGKADLIVGAPYVVPNGNIDVYKAGGTMTNQGAVASGHFGFSISGIGDIDGDGKADFVVGARAENKKGAVYVYSSKSGNNAKHTGLADNDSFGTSVSGAQIR
ncbi:MAG: FG-GAP-like repeat-containing protein [bacterium]